MHILLGAWAAECTKKAESGGFRYSVYRNRRDLQTRKEAAVASNKGEGIRNVALVGHSNSGKTMLGEAMLFKGGMLNRLGKVSDGTTASDFDVDEKEGKKSFYSALLHTP